MVVNVTYRRKRQNLTSHVTPPHCTAWCEFKSCHYRTGALAFTAIPEQPFPLPHYCAISDPPMCCFSSQNRC